MDLSRVPQHSCQTIERETPGDPASLCSAKGLRSYNTVMAGPDPAIWFQPVKDPRIKSGDDGCFAHHSGPARFSIRTANSAKARMMRPMVTNKAAA